MRQLKTCLLLIGLFVLFASSLPGQTVQGVVTGVVTDASGAVLTNVDVTLTNVGTNVVQKETTGSDGVYRFSLVPPGTYTVTLKANGFIERQVRDVVVDASKTVPVNATLSVATTGTTVEVTAQDTLVQTETSDLATTVNQRTIESTPLLTRNVFDLAFLAPQTTQGMNLNPASGGARESGTAYLLNGADNNDNFSEGGYNVAPPLESVAEFTVLTNNMSAQYGRAAGAVVSASQKSGTNRFHGVAYEFNRNRAFAANDFFSNRTGADKPKYNRNQFGGEVDGPIFKDKTFFAFAYDQIELHTGSNLTSNVPTPSELASISAGASPIAQYYLKKYPIPTSNTPCPNAPDESIGHIGCITVFNADLIPAKNYYGRIDHNFSSKDRIAASVNFNRSTETQQYNGGHFGVTAIPNLNINHYHNISLNETHMFNPRLLNEFTVAHNRHLSSSVEGDGKTTDPEIVIDGANYGNTGFGFGAYEGGLISSFTQDRWQIQDNLGYTIGRHSLKIGGGWQYGVLYRNWDLGSPGQYEFGNTTGATAASLGYINPDGSIGNVGDSSESNFQKDFPYFQELSVDPATGKKANAYRHYASKDFNLFINDDFKVNRRLSLTLGLRYERFGAPYEVNGILANFVNLNGYTPAGVAAARTVPVKSLWQTRNKDFAPRLGFAWDMTGNGRMSLRGGYGISYDRIFDNVWSNGAWNPPFYGLLDQDATSGNNIFYTVPGSVGTSYTPNSLPGSAGRVSVRTMEYNLKDSSSQNFYLGIERQFFHDVLVRVNYQGSLGRHLPVLMNLNRYDGLRYNATLSLTRPNALYTGFNYRANNVTSNYNAMVTEVQKRFSKGLQFQFSYTWSRLMDFGSDLFTGETTQGSYSQPYYFVSNSHRQYEYGPGGFDHTHNFKVNFTYEIPFMRDQQGFLGKAFGGWQFSSFYQGYSGHPLEVFSNRARYRGNALDANGIPENIGGDYNLDGVNNDHPTFVGSSFGAVYSGKSPADGWFTDNNSIGCGYAGAKSTNIAACNSANGVGTPNSLFVNPSGTGPRYGSLGRNAFRGPWFNGLNSALFKNFRVSEGLKLQIRAEALNFLNHPNFDGINTNLNSGQFGKAQILVGDAIARRFQFGARIVF